jgi:hypothetical protein
VSERGWSVPPLRLGMFEVASHTLHTYTAVCGLM